MFHPGANSWRSCLLLRYLSFVPKGFVNPGVVVAEGWWGLLLPPLPWNSHTQITLSWFFILFFLSLLLLHSADSSGISNKLAHLLQVKAGLEKLFLFENCVLRNNFAWISYIFSYYFKCFQLSLSLRSFIWWILKPIFQTSKIKH